MSASDQRGLVPMKFQVKFAFLLLVGFLSFFVYIRGESRPNSTPCVSLSGALAYASSCDALVTIIDYDEIISVKLSEMAEKVAEIHDANKATSQAIYDEATCPEPCNKGNYQHDSGDEIVKFPESPDCTAESEFHFTAHGKGDSVETAGQACVKTLDD